MENIATPEEGKSRKGRMEEIKVAWRGFIKHYIVKHTFFINEVRCKLVCHKCTYIKYLFSKQSLFCFFKINSLKISSSNTCVCFVLLSFNWGSGLASDYTFFFNLNQCYSCLFDVIIHQSGRICMERKKQRYMYTVCDTITHIDQYKRDGQCRIKTEIISLVKIWSALWA